MVAPDQIGDLYQHQERPSGRRFLRRYCPPLLAALSPPLALELAVMARGETDLRPVPENARRRDQEYGRGCLSWPSPPAPVDRSGGRHASPRSRCPDFAVSKQLLSATANRR